ncbi:MAG: ThuA domain-containing protein, partial [bacterium]|nr:ThuA domain-containing protein [bacterium]
ASTYLHDVDFALQVADAEHPVTRGVTDCTIHDETYLGCYIADDNHVLLTTDHATSDESIAWTRTYGKARVCYIQPGHGPQIFARPEYRKMLTQAVRWAAPLDPVRSN